MEVCFSDDHGGLGELDYAVRADVTFGSHHHKVVRVFLHRARGTSARSGVRCVRVHCELLYRDLSNSSRCASGLAVENQPLVSGRLKPDVIGPKQETSACEVLGT